MSSGATGSTQDGYLLRLLRIFAASRIFVNQTWLRERKMQPGVLLTHRAGHVLRDGDRRNASAATARSASQISKTAASVPAAKPVRNNGLHWREEMFSAGLLKISAADFIAWNLRCDSQNRNTATMTSV